MILTPDSRLLISAYERAIAAGSAVPDHAIGRDCTRAVGAGSVFGHRSLAESFEANSPKPQSQAAEGQGPRPPAPFRGAGRCRWAGIGKAMVAGSEVGARVGQSAISKMNKDWASIILAYCHHRAGLGTEDYAVVKSHIRVICEKE